MRDDVASALETSASGRELTAAGFSRDVEIAAATDVTAMVPVLEGEAFSDGWSRGSHTRGPARSARSVGSTTPS